MGTRAHGRLAGRRRRFAVGLALAWLLGAPGAARGGPPSASPSLIQAGFITKFPLFVTWPDPVRQPQRPVVVGVLGETPVLADLQQLAPYTEIDGRPLAVRPLAAPEDADGCQIVFIAADQRPFLDAILDILGRKPVLTVGASPGFGQQGVHVNFYLEDERVRFEVNPRACERSGLGLSFRLRNVARMVE